LPRQGALRTGCGEESRLELLGTLVFLAGLAVFAGQTWARATGIVLVSISAIVNFFFIPWAPIWAIAIIAIELWIIHALWVYRPAKF